MESVIVFGAVTVFNAVKPFQIRTCLRGCNGIIGRNRIFHKTQVKMLCHRTLFLQFFRRPQYRRFHFLIQAVSEVIIGNPDAHTLHIIHQRGSKIRICSCHGSGILLIVRSNRLKHRSAVRHGLRQRSDLIQRRTVSNQPVTGHRAVGRLHPHRSAVGCRLSDGAAGVGAKRINTLSRGHCSRRAAGRPARHMLCVPGISGHTVGGCFRRGTHGKLIHVGLAQDHRARSLQIQHCLRRVGGHKIAEYSGSACGEQASRTHIILDRHRHAG